MQVVQRSGSKENVFIIVLSLSMVLGMAVGVAVFYWWTSGAIAPGLQHPLTDLALLFCPPFILSLTIAPAPDPGFAWALVVGTTVFANGFLYAGGASFLYFIVITIRRRMKARVA